jgi:hypothetical protein
MSHLLQTVFNLKEGTPLQKALDRGAIYTHLDLITMRDIDFELLEYKDDVDGILPIPRGYANLLCAFKAFVLHLRGQGTVLEDGFWVTLTPDAFNNFRLSPEYSPDPRSVPTLTPPAPSQ